MAIRLIKALQQSVAPAEAPAGGERPRRGLTLVTVYTTNATLDRVLEIMGRHGVIAIQKHMDGWVNPQA